MTDNKLTDNDVIKALECCSEANNCGQCEYEPTEHQIGTVGCCNELMKDALDLINRLQADKQSLKYDYDNLQRQFDEIYQQFHYLSNVEIPYLYSFTEDKDKKLETIANILLRTKAEAYKEFAERLHEELRMYGTKDKFNKAVFLNVVDKAKKELVGE